MDNRKNGFTLIELLIVIAIIGILAAVLIPNLLQARARANNAAAQTCATGLATAAEIYNIDQNTYVGFAGAFAILNGANSCTSPQLAVTLGTPEAGGYSFTVGHVAGTGIYTVTPNGLTGPTGNAPAAAAPLPGA